MYTGSSKVIDFKRIDTFLLAYEMGSMHECGFREKLIKQIADKYGVQLLSEGFANQIKSASRKVKQKTEEFFLHESLQILVSESDNNNQNKFVRYCRKQLVQQLEQFPKEININWISNFSRNIRELKAWTGVNLTDDEMATSEKLIDKVNQLIKPDLMRLVAVPKKIEILKDELLHKINEQMR